MASLIRKMNDLVSADGSVLADGSSVTIADGSHVTIADGSSVADGGSVAEGNASLSVAREESEPASPHLEY